MARICGITSLVILVSSAAFHSATYIPAIPVTMNLAWPLHLATMAVFAIMAFSLVRQQKQQPKQPAKGLLARWRAANKQNKEFHSQLLGFVPRSLRDVCVATFIYAFINFALFMLIMEGGSPSVENGKYFLHNHGQKIRDISKQEYARFLAYEVRGFSGHWIVLSIIPAVYFLTVHPKLQEPRKRRMKG